MRFELFVAARYLRAKRRQAVIGVITVISVIGVTAGVASLVIALSINAGFQKDLQTVARFAIARQSGPDAKRH